MEDGMTHIVDYFPPFAAKSVYSVPTEFEFHAVCFFFVVFFLIFIELESFVSKNEAKKKTGQKIPPLPVYKMIYEDH